MSGLHALILAAGAGRRMGQTKALVIRNGVTFLAATVAAVDPHAAVVHVVIGHQAERVRARHSDLNVGWIEAASWAEGMGRSLSTGIEALATDESVRAVMVLPCDLPSLDASVVDEMIRCFGNTPNSIMACGYADTIGVPAIFSRKWFDTLVRCGDDRGARDFLRSRREQVEIFAWPEGAEDCDSDSG